MLKTNKLEKGQNYQINCRDFQSSDTVCKANQYLQQMGWIFEGH